MNITKKDLILYFIGAIILALGLGYIIGGLSQDAQKTSPLAQEEAPLEAADFEGCIDAGFPVMESYPRRCRDGAGTLHTEDIGNLLEMSAQITLENIQPNDTVASPLTITGEARAWYAEATFPVRLLDDQGKVIATGKAVAQEEWMVDAFVPFSVTLTFTGQEGKGTLIFEKGNQSGVETAPTELRIPVQF